MVEERIVYGEKKKEERVTDQGTLTPMECVLERLEGVKARQSGYEALCPAHADNNPSLSLDEGEDGRALLHCFAGCSGEEICKAVGLELRDLFPNRHIPVSASTGHTEFYTYHDQAGYPLYKIKRTPDKQFYPYVYDIEKQEFKRKAGWFGQQRVPYHLDKITSSTKTVFWVEGEKDADLLSSLGLIATTSPGGSNGYVTGLAEYLAGRKVVVIPDNDSAGRKYAEKVAESLSGAAEKVKWLQLPGLPENGDTSDFFDFGGTKASFLEYARKSPDFRSASETFTEADEGFEEEKVNPLTLLSMCTLRDIPEQEYLVNGLIPAGHPSMMFGDGGVGKSVLCLSMSCALAAGLPDWLGFSLKQTNVLYLDYEMPFEEQVRRARKIAKGLGLAQVPENLFYLAGSPEYSWSDIKETCLGSEIGLLVVDSFGPALAGDMEASNDIIAYIRDFVKPLLNHGITVHFIDHQPKAQGSNYQDMTAFGSVYKRNLVRSQIQVEGRQDDEDSSKYQVIFRHKKHNFGPKLQPFGAELIFDDDAILLRSLAMDLDTMMKEKDIKVDDRILLALYDEGGPLTKQEIGERIGAAAGSVANAITTLRKRDQASESGERRGHQSLYEIMQKGANRVEMDLSTEHSPNGWQDGGKGFVE